MVQLAANIWADGPALDPYEPPKSDIRDWGTWLEGIVNAFTSNGGLVYASRALLYADLAHVANTSAWVIGDSTVAYNGVYTKVGASGSGSWLRISDLPYSFIVASNSGAGTGNAIIATTSIPVSASALVVLNITATNASSPVTVAFNGGVALTLKTNSGNDISVGGLVSGLILFGFIQGSNFRCINDQVASAVQAAAEAAAAAAEAARDAALGAVPNSFPPTRTAMAAQPSTVTYSYLTEAGREGLFKLTTGDFSTAGTDDPTQGIIVPLVSDPTTKAYVRVSPPYLTPGMFGIPAGNTTVDYSVAWQGMINMLIAGYGNKHIVVDRDIVISGGHFIGTWPDNVLIEGKNGCGFVEISTAPTAWLLHFNPAITGLTIRNINFRNLNATSRLTANQAIGFATSGTKCLIENCTFSGFAETIWLNNAKYTNIRKNYIKQAWGDGIHLAGGSVFCEVTDNTVQSTGDDMIACTTDATGGNTTVRTNNIIITGNLLDNGAGTCGNGVALYNSDDVLVADNIMTNIKGNGVSIHTYSAGWGSRPAILQQYCQRLKVTGNYISNVGLALVDPDGVSYATNKGHGHGVYLDGGSNIDVSDNTIMVSNVSPNPYRSGLFMTSDTAGYGLSNIRIRNNSIQDIGGAGIQGFSTGSGNGCANILVSGNYIFNTTSWAIDWSELYFTGKLTVRDNTAVLVDTDTSSKGMAFAAGTTSMIFDTSGNFIPSGYSLSLTGSAASWTRRNTTNTF
ncbi:right-handed parallel beta-helix repeat-containing protein [Rhizobium leucaenae]|uniref:right-handed parallel beta-helix repeat-containing protein n=1 Tax=Rhizobium leucaenae TaxID=29450 RepID=UPI0007EE2A7B|nr:right-handed parallel beta-helix repeat-containing protein [Rhizobium leucaenae]MBB6299896.1 hypothetical protein [Rhizobium leucaenae]